MICTVNARGVFGFERLEYMREFRSGISCTAYWLAKMIWNCLNWYMYALCFSLPLYYMMPLPAQSFGDFFWAHLWAAWYHLGLGMMLTVVFTNTTTSLLMCVFFPMILEIAFSGGMTKVKDMDPISRFVSNFSCGRWFKQYLFLKEINMYPSHTHNFPEVQDTMDDFDMTLDDADIAIFWLFFSGMLMRLWALSVLLLLKYSEGDSCVGRIIHLISKGLDKMGMSALIAPKKGDTTRVVFERKPSLKLSTSSKAEPALLGSSSA